MTDQATPRQLVDALGTTPAEIAATLANKGITGRLRKASYCPIANYLREQDYQAQVSRWLITVRGGTDTYKMPPAATEFVELFDRGQFPELVDPGDTTRLAMIRSTITVVKR